MREAVRILLDMVSSQGKANGGAEYSKRLFSECLKAGIGFDILVDGSMELDVGVRNAAEKAGVGIVNIRMIDFIAHLNQYYDRFVICIMQRFMEYGLERLDIRLIVVWHDIRGLDLGLIRYYDYLFRRAGVLQFLKDSIKVFMLRIGAMYSMDLAKYQRVKGCLLLDGNVVVTDSDYTKFSINYFFPEIRAESIRVLYPPQKEDASNTDIFDSGLRNFLQRKHKYMMLLSCHRPDKNADVVIRALPRLLEDDPDLHVLLIGKVRHTANKRVLNIDYLKQGDLEHAYRNAFAFVYPSLSEGFGYPPLEAMKYGTPVISSNCSSMPEILSEGAVFFSPFYVNDFYGAFRRMAADRGAWSEKAKSRYAAVERRQAEDLRKLVDGIIFG
jgi:glycosyltransferase involved in cell wall biosynthesis